MVSKFSFAGWNLYHKSIIFLLIAVVLAAIARAIVAYNGGATFVSRSMILHGGAEDVWPWVLETEKRPRWEAHVVDLSKLQGRSDAEGSTRFVFWRDLRGKRWTGIEATVSVVPGLSFKTFRESDLAERNWTVRLDPLDTCKTRVTIEEIVKPARYTDRYWSFAKKGHYEIRLDKSLAALQRWVRQSDSMDCFEAESE